MIKIGGPMRATLVDALAEVIMDTTSLGLDWDQQFGSADDRARIASGEWCARSGSSPRCALSVGRGSQPERGLAVVHVLVMPAA